MRNLQCHSRTTDSFENTLSNSFLSHAQRWRVLTLTNNELAITLAALRAPDTTNLLLPPLVCGLQMLQLTLVKLPGKEDLVGERDSCYYITRIRCLQLICLDFHERSHGYKVR